MRQSVKIPKMMAFAGTVFVTAIVLSMAVSAKMNNDPYLRPFAAPAPADNTLNSDRVALGKMLFFDPRLSGSKWISCATCHNPAMGWSDGLPTAIGDGMRVLERSTPTILNTAFNKLQMWDGRFRTLEEQALGPIQADVEMHQDMKTLLKELGKISGYVSLFEKAYPGEGINEKTLAKAIASFERTVLSTESPFDLWRKGNEKAVSTEVKRGFKLFEGKANCVLCHQGFNFADDGFHNIGLKDNKDDGRFAKVPVKVLKGAFKTPTLRDIALTAPYMHNGAYKTLEEVIEHYNQGGVDKTYLDPNMEPLNLNSQEKADLVAFLKSLTGEPMAITIPRLPN